jgi:hypothetical protein
MFPPVQSQVIFISKETPIVSVKYIKVYLLFCRTINICLHKNHSYHKNLKIKQIYILLLIESNPGRDRMEVLTIHASISPIRVGSRPALYITNKSALDLQPQVIKFTSYLPMVGGSHHVLRPNPPLEMVAMI